MCLDKLKNSDITDKKNYIELICKDLSSDETLGYICSNSFVQLQIVKTKSMLV